MTKCLRPGHCSWSCPSERLDFLKVRFYFVFFPFVCTSTGRSVGVQMTQLIKEGNIARVVTPSKKDIFPSYSHYFFGFYCFSNPVVRMKIITLTSKQTSDRYAHTSASLLFNIFASDKASSASAKSPSYKRKNS